MTEPGWKPGPNSFQKKNPTCSFGSQSRGIPRERFLEIAAIIQKELHTPRPRTHHSPGQLVLSPSPPPSEEEPTQTPLLSACFFQLICSCFQLTSYPDKRLSQKPMPKTAQRPRPSQAYQSQPAAASGVSASAPPWSLPQEPSPAGHTGQRQQPPQGRCSLANRTPDHPPGHEARRSLKEKVHS